MLTPSSESAAVGVTWLLMLMLMLPLVARYWAASDSLAAATVASAVIPNSRNRVL